MCPSNEFYPDLHISSLIMARSDQKSIFVFREQPHLFGILPGDFDTYLPLEQVSISHDSENPLLWIYEEKQTSKKGYFIHPALLLGFKKITFSKSGILFLKNNTQETDIGILMNDFLMKIVQKKAGSRTLSVDLVKNFPSEFPKRAFRFVQRFKRQNILVINPEGLIKEFNLSRPQLKS